MTDPYVWIDPADAVFVQSCRDAMKIERLAWERCNAERMALRKRVRELEDQVRQGPGSGHPDPPGD